MRKDKHQYFIIGGTIKGATSSLFNYISEHPQVCGSRVKETFFFSQQYCGDVDLDREKYNSYFVIQDGHSVLAEASPNYLAFKENVAPRIKTLLPNAKILFVLRDPVERLYSHYHFARGKLQLPDTMSFERYVELCDAFNVGRITTEEAGLAETHLRALEIGNYGNYLKNFYAVMDAENIKVIFMGELNSRPVETLVEVSKFIGIDPAFYENYVMIKANVTFSARVKLIHAVVLWFNRLFEPVLRRHPGIKHRLVKLYKFFNRSRKTVAPMQLETRSKLQSYYAPSNARVKQLLENQLLPRWLD